MCFACLLCCDLGVIQNCHHFHESTPSTLGVKGCRTLFFNVDYDALHFRAGVAKINILKVLFWEGGREGCHKKEYSVYAFDNVDTYGRPLSDGRIGPGVTV